MRAIPHSSDISKLWTHWAQHQENGMVGLAFIWCDPKDLYEVYSRRKGKGKEKAYKEIDDDDDDDDDEDEDEDEDEDDEEDDDEDEDEDED